MTWDVKASGDLVDAVRMPLTTGKGTHNSLAPTSELSFAVMGNFT